MNTKLYTYGHYLFVDISSCGSAKP